MVLREFRAVREAARRVVLQFIRDGGTMDLEIMCDGSAAATSPQSVLNDDSLLVPEMCHDGKGKGMRGANPHYLPLLLTGCSRMAGVAIRDGNW